MAVVHVMPDVILPCPHLLYTSATSDTIHVPMYQSYEIEQVTCVCSHHPKLQSDCGIHCPFSMWWVKGHQNVPHTRVCYFMHYSMITCSPPSLEQEPEECQRDLLPVGSPEGSNHHSLPLWEGCVWGEIWGHLVSRNEHDRQLGCRVSWPLRNPPELFSGDSRCEANGCQQCILLPGAGQHNRWCLYHQAVSIHHSRSLRYGVCFL